MTISRSSSLIGQKFGKLTVTHRDHSRPSGKNKPAFWLCKCDCGKEASADTASLRNGRRISCGCEQVFNKKRKGAGPPLAQARRMRDQYRKAHPKINKTWSDYSPDDRVLDSDFDFDDPERI